MTVTAVRKDPDALTLTLTAEFDASPERVWELWADPRQLERWWGPPTYPATFTATRPGARQSRRVPHDRADGRPAARLLGHPRGRSPAPARLPRRVRRDDGTPNDDFPRNEGRVTIEPIDAGRTRMSIESHFPSTEAMEQVPGLGMEEGLTQAVGQIDAILAEGVRERSGTTMTEPGEEIMTMRRRPTSGGARRRPDLRHPEGTAPVLLLIGSPMGAAGFGTLAGHFTDRTVVTYDPRGVERSTKADPTSPSTPEEHADDLHRLISILGTGPATCSPAAAAR